MTDRTLSHTTTSHVPCRHGTGRRWGHQLFVIALAVVVIYGPGCRDQSDGPKRSEVSGIVTLDGKPLPQAAILFQPETGRMSYATTGDSGEYTLKYTNGASGAVIGKSVVVIRTEVLGEDGLTPIRKELLPRKYHDKTELTAEVADGQNTINFDLTSK